MAVYTHIAEDALRAHLTQYSLGPLVSFASITEGVENTNYKIITSAGPFILTLFEKRTRAEDLPFFIAFMNHLHAHHIPCPAVIAAADGRHVLTLGGRPSIITSFLPGAGPREIGIDHVQAVGGLLARMHKAGEIFPQKRHNGMSLPEWATLLRACAGKSDLVPPLLDELAYLEQNMPQALPRGTVHADFFPDNVFFKEGAVTGVIDFYFACSEFFAYDLMLALNAWCFEPAGFSREKARALLGAYQKERPLSAEEHNALPLLGRAAALRIISTRLYDWLHCSPNALVKPKDPAEYVDILRFHQNISFAP